MQRKSDRATAQVQYFSDNIRSQLRKIKETSRRGPPVNDWDRVWEDLELAAQAYHQGVKFLSDRDRDLPPLTPREALDALRKHRKTVDSLIRQLQDPRLWEWAFIGENGYWARGETPLSRFPSSLVRDLVAHCGEASREIGQLKQFTQRPARSMTARDYMDLFLQTLFEIAHGLFGPEIGAEDGPLLRFVSQVAQAVLGELTPPPKTLRTIDRRRLTPPKSLRTITRRR
jgi:hypothetical protein